MSGRLASRARNGAKRRQRDLRFVLADRYRALLGSRFVALAAFAAAVLDGTLGAVTSLRRPRRRTGEVTLTVADAVLAAGRQLSVTVRTADDRAAASLGLRRAGETVTLDTLGDHIAGVTRLVAVVPDGVTGTWTVTLDGRDLAVGTAAGLPKPVGGDEHGRLAVTLDPDTAAGAVAEVTVGVRTVLIRWDADPATTAGAELWLVPADGSAERRFPAPVRNGRATASVPLAGLAATSWTAFCRDTDTDTDSGTGTVGRAPLGLPRGDYPPLRRFAAAHRVVLPADGTGAARAVSVGYDDGNRLTVRVEPLVAAAS